MFQYFWLIILGICLLIIAIAVIEDIISAFKKTWKKRASIHSFVDFLLTYISFLNFYTILILGFILLYLTILSLSIYRDNHLELSSVPWRR